jgi:hypothetical protein
LGLEIFIKIKFTKMIVAKESTIETGLVLLLHFSDRYQNNIPEDPAYSTPDGSKFFIFSRRYVRDTMCNSVFFSTISGPFSHNLDRDIGPGSRFFEFFFVFL